MTITSVNAGYAPYNPPPISEQQMVNFDTSLTSSINADSKESVNAPPAEMPRPPENNLLPNIGKALLGAAAGFGVYNGIKSLTNDGKIDTDKENLLTKGLKKVGDLFKGKAKAKKNKPAATEKSTTETDKPALKLREEKPTEQKAQEKQEIHLEEQTRGGAPATPLDGRDNDTFQFKMGGDSVKGTSAPATNEVKPDKKDKFDLNGLLNNLASYKNKDKEYTDGEMHVKYDFRNLFNGDAKKNKDTYRNFMMEAHPDKNPEKKIDSEIFTDLKFAYEKSKEKI